MHSRSLSAGSMLFIAIKLEHYEHLQLTGNYYVTELYSVITSMGLRSQLGLVNVMCGDLILRSAIKLNDLYRTVPCACFSGRRSVSVLRGDESQRCEKVSVWAESNASRF